MTIVSRKYRDIASSTVGEGLFLVDVGGRVVYADVRLNDLLKLNPNDIIHKNFRYLFRRIGEVSTDADVVESQLEAAHRDLAQQPTVYLNARYSPGSRLQVRLRTNADWEGWLGTVRDVSDEWRSFAKQSEYLGIILRALRSTHASIKGLVDTLLASHLHWPDEQRHEFLQDIERNMSKMSQVLDYGQQTLNLYTGSVKLNRRYADPKARVQQVLRSMSIKQSDRQFQVSLPDDLPEILVDVACFDQLVRYLLSNAIASSPPQGYIKVAAACADGEFVISVTDQSAGLSNIQLVQMLDIPTGPGFWERDELLEANLGLFIARELARAHGGHLWAESTQGVGTTVHCALPIHDNNPIQARPVPEKRHTGALSTPGMAPRSICRILIVDDDLEMAKLMQAVLERNGFQVSHAVTGARALEMAVERRPDLVLLDMYLPDGNGMEVGMQLRQFTSVPVIMVSVNQRPEDRARALDLGIDDYLVKPVNWTELVARIRARLRLSSSLQTNSGSYTYHELQIDFRQRKVELGHQELRFSPKEYDFIALLASNAGQVLTHDYILEKIWGDAQRAEKRNLWVISSRVRKKLGDDTEHPKYIRSDPGVGYFMPEALSGENPGGD